MPDATQNQSDRAGPQHRPGPGAPDAVSSSGESVLENVEGLIGLALRQIRRLLVFLIGTSVVLIGVIMFFTPGPAIIVIPLGLGILAIEFAWARLLLRRFREKAGSMGQEVRGLISAPRADSERDQQALDRRRAHDDMA